MSGTAIILACGALAAVLAAAVCLVRRRNRRRAAVFLSFPTRFGKARIFTIRYDTTVARSAPSDSASDGPTPKPRGQALSRGESADAVSDDEPVWIRVLELDGAYQAATFIDDDRCYELVFDYYRLYNRMFEAHRPIRRVLMLGGGGYSYPKYLISHYPDIVLDVVEIDPAITALAERYFFLDRLIEEFDTERCGRLRLINADGRTFLDGLPADERYDAILNDCFAGRDPVRALATVEAARAIRAHLAPGGVYLSNVITAREGEQAQPLRAAAATLSTVFAHEYAIPCDRFPADARDNYMVIATDSADSFTGAFALDPAGAAPLRD